jgi:hypothetical protein
MTLGRRAFLTLASTSPLVFGLADLHARAQKGEAPEWWKRALDRMKELQRPWLVFIMPVTEELRDQVAQHLLDLLEDESPEIAEVFCSTVVACLRPAVADACLKNDAVPGRVLALDPSGRVVGKCELEFDDLREPEDFEARYMRLVHGEKRNRFEGIAEGIRAKLTDEERKAFDLLDAEELAVRERATEVLARRAEVLMPLLVFERRRALQPEKEARLRRIIHERFKAADEKKPGPRLPFGTRIVAGGGCGADEGRGAIQCGMAQQEGKGQRFLRFLNHD